MATLMQGAIEGNDPRRMDEPGLDRVLRIAHADHRMLECSPYDGPERRQKGRRTGHDRRLMARVDQDFPDRRCNQERRIYSWRGIHY